MTNNNQNESQAQPVISLPLILDMLSRYRWRFIIVSYLIAMIVFSLYLMHPKSYRGNARIERRSELIDVSIIDKDLTQVVLWRAEVSESMKQQEIYDKVIERIRSKVLSGEYESFPVTNQKAISMMNSASISVTKSDVLDRVNVSIQSREPVATRMIINEWIDVFVAEAMSEVTKVIEEREQFFENEVAKRREELVGYRLKFNEFTHQNMAVIPPNRNNTRLKMENIETEIDALELLMSNQMHSKAKIRSQLDDYAKPKEIRETVEIPNPEYQPLKAKIFELETEIEEAKIQKGYTEKHPTMQILNRDLERFKKLASTTPKTLKTVKVTTEPLDLSELKLELQLLEMQSETTKIKRDDLVSDLKKLEADFQRVSVVANEYSEYESRLLELNANLKRSQEKLEEVRSITQDETGLQTYEIYVASRCPVLKRAVDPSFRNILMISAGLAVGLGGLVVFISYKGNNSISSVEEAKKLLPLRILGVIEDIRTESEMRWDRMRRMVFMPTLSVIMIGTLLSLAALNYLILNGNTTLEETGAYVQQVFVSLIR